MAYYIIGTAGHVDHGKTSLIQAMTGVDADRLPEEKERGLTIDLGFSHMALPSGDYTGIIDVPGHEKFLKNLLAGIGTIDFALLVIDAGEGIMPQTIEHLSILKLLGIKRGIAVLTKIDIVPQERIEAVEKEVKEFLKGSMFEGVPIRRLSSKTGEGINELIYAIDREIAQVPPKNQEGIFRMTVDRTFLIQGSGLVVTGSILSGSIEVGDNLSLLPKGLKTRVRGIQMHNQIAKSAQAGQRIAINLTKINIEDIRRGDQLVTPGIMRGTRSIDVYLEVLPSAPNPLKNRSEISLHIGSDFVQGKIHLLDRDELHPGEWGFAQLNLKAETSAFPYDLFILRAPSSIFTWGGGTVLDPYPTQHRRYDRKVIELLEIKKNRDFSSLLELLLKREPYRIYNMEELGSLSAVSFEILNKTLHAMKEQGTVIEVSQGRYADLEIYNEYSQKLMAILTGFQEREPHKRGRTPTELQKNLPLLSESFFRELLMKLKMGNKLKETAGLISTTDFSPKLEKEMEEIRQGILQLMEEGIFSPPNMEDIAKKLGIEGKKFYPVVEFLKQTGEIVPLNEKVFYTRNRLEQAKKIIAEQIGRQGFITPGQVKELLNASRKYVIPLLEYLDNTYFTLRQEDKRVLFKAKGEDRERKPSGK